MTTLYNFPQIPLRHFVLKIVLLFCLFFAANIQAANRVALVIGNNDYSQSPLKNPVNDATAIGKTLKSMGFSVVDAYNVDRSGMEDALDEFGEQAEKAEIAIVYYAGHAIQVDGVNYLIPANTPVKNRRHLRKLINLNEMVKEAQQARGLGLVMLDACRDNPFSSNLQQSLGRSIGGRGLARVEDTPSNILIGFATKENGIAADGNTKHSPYAAALLQYLPQKNLEIRLLFGKVHDAVKQATGQKQKPYTYGALGGNEWFLAGGRPVVVADNSGGNGGIFSPPLKFPEPEMLSIKGGCFQMGQTKSEKQWLIKQAGQEEYDKYYTDEIRNKVCVDDFELGKYEVTVGEFRKFTQATGYKTEAEKDVNKGCYGLKGNKWQYIAGRNWKNTGFSQNDKHPVACVSWNDATRYIDWLQKKTQKSYRLPTEAEWEFAARAGTKTMRYWGNDEGNTKACGYANVTNKSSKKYNWSASFSCDDGYDETAPVGMFTANKFGLKDMLGNVWEWTCSAYSKDGVYDGSETQCTNKNDTRSRVLRGGSWYLKPRYVRSAFRFRYAAATRYSLVGFRLSRTR